MAKGIITFKDLDDAKKSLDNYKKTVIQNPTGNPGVEGATYKITDESSTFIEDGEKITKSIEIIRFYKGDKEVGYIKFYPATTKVAAVQGRKVQPGVYVTVVVGGENESTIFKRLQTQFGDRMSVSNVQKLKETNLLNIYKSITNGR
jgi:hypothetical protein